MIRRAERIVDRLAAAGFRHVDVTLDEQGRLLSMELKRRSDGMLWHFGPGGDEW